jgi:hypothetical protein
MIIITTVRWDTEDPPRFTTTTEYTLYECPEGHERAEEQLNERLSRAL